MHESKLLIQNCNLIWLDINLYFKLSSEIARIKEISDTVTNLEV